MELATTYNELMKGSHDGWVLEKVFFLELEHPCWGTFPALFKEGDRVVLTLDKALLEEVRSRLSRRASKITESNFIVNHELSVGYPTIDRGQPSPLLTRTEFEALVKNNPNPFEWAPGLIGDDMTKDEFIKTLDFASERHSA
jgi:hypothetical protein